MPTARPRPPRECEIGSSPRTRRGGVRRRVDRARRRPNRRFPAPCARPPSRCRSQPPPPPPRSGTLLRDVVTTITTTTIAAAMASGVRLVVARAQGTSRGRPRRGRRRSRASGRSHPKRTRTTSWSSCCKRTAQSGCAARSAPAVRALLPRHRIGGGRGGVRRRRRRGERGGDDGTERQGTRQHLEEKRRRTETNGAGVPRIVSRVVACARPGTVRRRSSHQSSHLGTRCEGRDAIGGCTSLMMC